MSENIQFNFSPFDEDIVIVGGKSNGKTTRIKSILGLVSRLPYVVYDYNYNFSGFGQIVRDVNQIKYGQYIFQPIDKSYSTFQKFCNRMFFGSQSGELAHMIVVIDELHQYVSKQKSCHELESIVQTARNFGLSGIYASTRPASIPNYILTNSAHCFAFRLSNLGDIEWLRDYIGEKAWLLLPRDKRKFLKDEPELTKHSCIYRNQNESDAQIIYCNCETCKNG